MLKLIKVCVNLFCKVYYIALMFDKNDNHITFVYSVHKYNIYIYVCSCCVLLSCIYIYRYDNNLYYSCTSVPMYLCLFLKAGYTFFISCTTLAFCKY